MNATNPPAQDAEGLSTTEQVAARMLEGYELGFVPLYAYLGRARHLLDKPTASQLIDCVLDLVKIDNAQADWLAHRKRQVELMRRVEEIQLTDADRLDFAHLEQLLRELVELDRAKAQPDVPRGTRIRVTLYPDKLPKPGADPSFGGSLRLGSRSFSLRAWVASNHEFINLELS